MGDLGKLIVAKGFKKLPKVPKIVESGHTGHTGIMIHEGDYERNVRNAF